MIKMQWSICMASSTWQKEADKKIFSCHITRKQKRYWIWSVSLYMCIWIWGQWYKHGIVLLIQVNKCYLRSDTTNSGTNSRNKKNMKVLGKGKHELRFFYWQFQKPSFSATKEKCNRQKEFSHASLHSVTSQYILYYKL